MVPILRRHVRVPAVGIGFVALAVAGILLTDPVTPEKARLAAPTAQLAPTQVTADTGTRADGWERSVRRHAGRAQSRPGAGWRLLAV